MAGHDSESGPSEVFLYRGDGSIPRDAVRVEAHHSVTFIPNRLFNNCNQLESVLLHEGLIKIGNNAFWDCTSLPNVRIPSTVTEIGDGAFCGCSSLAAVELPEGLKRIEEWTFHGCESLEAVKVPASVARIGVGAFAECSNLASVGLREGLQTIGYSAFDDCESLASLRVPLSVKGIEEHAFSGCSSLTSVQLSEDLPKLKRFAFGGCPLESFRFVHLSERMEVIRMDGQTKSMFESRLREITNHLTTAEHDVEVEDEYDSDEAEEYAEALWEKCKESLERAHEVLTYLELKGAPSVLELALWKAKIEGEGEEGQKGELVNDEDRGQDLSDAVRERKRPKVMKSAGQDARLSRKECRVKCGTGIVLPEVLKFFNYSSSWPQLFNDSEEEDVG